MTKILAINGSYRDDGITDQTVTVMAEAARSAGAEVEIILLRDYPINFCKNCRQCTQQPGEAPGICIQQDGMQTLVEKIEQADAYILASPTNFSSVTALFKRFMERLVVYGYWPWGKDYPEFRKAKLPKKKAALISSCAAPGLLGRFLYSSRKQLKITAETIGAKPVGMLFSGMISKQPNQHLPEKLEEKARALAEKLL